MVRQHYVWKVIVLNNRILRSNLAKGTKISCVSCCEKNPLYGSLYREVSAAATGKIMTTWWNEIGSRLLPQHSGQSSEFVTAPGRRHSQAIFVFPPTEWKCEVASGARDAATLSAMHNYSMRCERAALLMECTILTDGTWQSRSALTWSVRSVELEVKADSSLLRQVGNWEQLSPAISSNKKDKQL